MIPSPSRSNFRIICSPVKKIVAQDGSGPPSTNDNDCKLTPIGSLHCFVRISLLEIYFIDEKHRRKRRVSRNKHYLVFATLTASICHCEALLQTILPTCHRKKNVYGRYGHLHHSNFFHTGSSTKLHIADEQEFNDGEDNDAGVSTKEQRSTHDIEELCLLVAEDDSFYQQGELDLEGTPSAENLEKQIFQSLGLKELLKRKVIDFVVILGPVIVPFIAFYTFENSASVFDMTIEYLSNKNWYSVDGGQLEVQLLIPTINGIVVPSVSILFATLISNTVSTLRQRQLDIRTALNDEANEIRVLNALIDAFPEEPEKLCDAKDKCKYYLTQYTTRIIAESQPGVSSSTLEFAGSMDSEMNGLLIQITAIERMSSKSFRSANFLSQSYDALTRLDAHRSRRISALLSTFPLLHYYILTMLALSICFVFMIESSQEVLYFLNAIQLRILWAILIGTFSALSAVCYDLLEPFRGSYQIRRSTDQFYTIRSALKAQTSCRVDNEYE